MKLHLITVAAIALLAGTATAIAQPHGRGGGYGMLENDANGDGKLTRAEFDAAQRARFALVDANKDGSATPEEFKTLRDAEGQKRQADMTKARFSGLDTDGNGQISQSEFAVRAKAEDGRGPGFRGGHDGRGGRGHPGKDGGRDGGKHPGKIAGDANADAKLTLAEFSARGVEAFTRADANKDGTVTITELQALGAARR
jgi:Ca2+-binding EF-hand superfamily protein